MFRDKTEMLHDQKCDTAAADYKEASLSYREPPERQQDDETTPIMVVFGDSTHNNDLDQALAIGGSGTFLALFGNTQSGLIKVIFVKKLLLK
ncbi:MAG: hypothetical protein MHMPM18_004190 [Marteilia pararefringens]